MIARDVDEFDRACRGLPRAAGEDAGQREVVCLSPDTFRLVVGVNPLRSQRRRLCIVRVPYGLRVVSVRDEAVT